MVERWIARLVGNPELVMCLPTGNTPRPMYVEMGPAVAGERLSFGTATVFLLDEFGGLAADDPARCDGMLRRDLLDHIDLPAENFHRLDPEADDLDAEVADYRTKVLTAGLDLTIVGLGPNGHIGLNEPGSTVDSITRRALLHPDTKASMTAYGGDSATDWGLTVGIDEIMTSREVWLIVTGTSKAKIIQEVLEGPISPDRPASLLRDHPNARALVDAAAAVHLNR